jgi:hypothetical protein
MEDQESRSEIAMKMNLQSVLIKDGLVYLSINAGSDQAHLELSPDMARSLARTLVRQADHAEARKGKKHWEA